MNLHALLYMNSIPLGSTMPRRKYHTNVITERTAGNIWVHLLPALLLGTAVMSGSLLPWPLARVAFWEAVVPILVCLSGSVLYHTLMANHWHYQKYLFIDVSLLSLLAFPYILLL